MYYLTILIGVFLGVTLFLFLFIAVKKTGSYYLPPLITFLFAIAVIVYSLMIGDIGRLDYGLLGIGFLIAAVLCALLLPAKLRTTEKRHWTKGDVAGLIFLPCIIATSFALFMHFNEDYWIIEESGLPYAASSGDVVQNEYHVSTNSNGDKTVRLALNSEEFVGKRVIVDNITQHHSTVVTLKIVEGNSDTTPLIKIGLHEIHEPIKVKTTNGDIIQSFNRLSVKE